MGGECRILEELERVVEARAKSGARDSFTVRALAEGVGFIARKVGEEAAEVLVAALAEGDRRRVAEEAADLLYMLTLLLYSKGVSWEEVIRVLDERRAKLGLGRRVLVVGLGEVGSALYKIMESSGRLEVYGYDIDPSRTINKLDEIPEVDYLHVAIPYDPEKPDAFLEAVKEYVKRFKPRMVFIHSTVAPGTTRRLYNETNVAVAYTPVRGKHPCLETHMRFWPKWVTTLPLEKLAEAAAHLAEAGFRVKPCNCTPESLELAKLWETVYRALMIAAWQELHRIALKFNADIAVVAEFVAEVHEVLRDRPVFYPGVIGGHCLIPNTRILRSVYDSKMLEFILESNEARVREEEREEVRRDIERVKAVAMRLANTMYYNCLTPGRSAGQASP